ncbi:MAG: DUF2799 domain-containing protein [Alphaproteobacteria bacterium]|nr:DUF2799 domain-containing protein [Alphaproteobacteria bacterium]
MRRVFGMMFVLALAGCGGGSGMQEAECLTADWRAVGYEDGAQGYGPQQLTVRRKACAEYGVAPDFNAYMAGREEGLLYYCRPQNGYNVGNSGYRYSGQCPPHMEPAFVAAHADGFGLYQRRARMQNIGKRLSYSRQRSQELEYELADRTMAMATPVTGLTAADMAARAIELKQLAQEKVEIEQAIQQLEIDYSAAQYDYEAYRDQISGRYSG